MDTGVYYLLQWLIALRLVGIIKFADFTNEWTFLQKHGAALSAAGWMAGAIPVVMLVLSVVTSAVSGLSVVTGCKVYSQTMSPHRTPPVSTVSVPHLPAL